MSQKTVDLRIGESSHLSRQEQWRFFDSMNERERNLLPLPKDYCESRGITPNRSMSLQEIFSGMSEEQILKQAQQAVGFVKQMGNGTQS